MEQHEKKRKSRVPTLLLLMLLVVPLSIFGIWRLINSSEDVQKSSPSQTTERPVARAIDLQVNHPNGSVLRVTRINFASDSTTLDMAIANGSDKSIKLNSNSDMLLQDDQGNQYNLAPSPANPQVEVAPGQTLRGQFVFLGLIAPNANSITLYTNNKFGSNAEFADNPKMVIADIPVRSDAQGTRSSVVAAPAAPGGSTQTPSAPASAPVTQTQPKGAPVAIAPTPNLQVNHANGAVMRLIQVTPTDDNIVLNLTITNRSKKPIKLNKNREMVVRDNLGNRYNLIPPPANKEVQIDPGATLKGEFVFLGRLAPDANAITAIANEKFGSDANEK